MPEPRHVNVPRAARGAAARILRWALVRLILFFCLTPATLGREPFSFSPVRQLRLALKIPVQDFEPNSKDLQLRQNSLQERVAALCLLPDIREALMLDEWRDDDTDERISSIDRAARIELTKRFEHALHDVLRQGDPASRVAAAAMLSELPAPVRMNGIQGWTLRCCTADLADLVRDGEPPVQTAAARALGRINADPALAVPALAKLFQSDDAASRRAAADGLSNFMGMVSQVIHRPNGAVERASCQQVLQAGRAVVPVVGGGLADPDPEVRRLSIEAIQRTAGALVRLVGDPPGGNNPRELENYWLEVEKQYAELAPLANDLKDQTAGLTNALSDPVPAVRLQADRALEDIGRARLRLEARASAGPVGPHVVEGQTTSAVKEGSAETPPKEGAPSPRPLLERLQAALPALATAVSDPDLAARRAAIDALETLGSEASLAVPALIGALADPDPFVRWAAARTLAKMSPGEDAGKVVAALIQRLSDRDLDVRLAAAHTLEQYGASAQEAVPTLTRAVSTGDSDMRLAAMHALEGIGMDAQSAIPALAAGLRDPDARVRQGAARLLGKFGPTAVDQKDALRTALADKDPDVCKAASDALLQILPPPSGSPPQIMGQACPADAPPADGTREQSGTWSAGCGADVVSGDWQTSAATAAPDPAVPGGLMTAPVRLELSNMQLAAIPADSGPSLPAASTPETATGPVLSSGGDQAPAATAASAVATPSPIPGAPSPSPVAGLDSWRSTPAVKESSAVVPASVWQEGGSAPALGTRIRYSQANLLRPVPAAPPLPPETPPAAFSPAVADQASCAAPVATPPSPPVVLMRPSAWSVPGIHPPGTVIATSVPFN
jgi:HEAT repeat protein